VTMPAITSETFWGLFPVDPDVAAIVLVVAQHKASLRPTGFDSDGSV
jgi:hypothetical protein